MAANIVATQPFNRAAGTMGLDLVEFVMALEETFGIDIPDEDAGRLATPRKVVDYLQTRLPPYTGSMCFSQRAFHRLRSGITSTFQVPRSRVTPRTGWHEILPDRGAGIAWHRLGEILDAPAWPPRSFVWTRRASTITVGATATFLADTVPHYLKRSDEGWSRPEIERMVTTLIDVELGVTDFDWDDSFVEDLRLD